MPVFSSIAFITSLSFEPEENPERRKCSPWCLILNCCKEEKHTGIYSYWTDFQCLHSYRVVLPVLITSIHTDVHAINWDHYVCSVLSLRRELILAGLPASLLRNNGTCRNDTSCLKSFNVATTLLYIKIIGKEVH